MDSGVVEVNSEDVMVLEIGLADIFNAGNVKWAQLSVDGQDEVKGLEQEADSLLIKLGYFLVVNVFNFV